MLLWNFLKAEARISIPRLAGMAVVSGLSNSVLLAVINIAAGYASNTYGADTGQKVLFLGFIIALALYVMSQRYILRISNTEIERMVVRLRIRLADKIRKADLQPIETLGRERIYAAVNRDTQTISQAASPTIIAIQSAVMVVFIALYIALLNRPAFLITLVIVGIGVVIHTRKREELMRDLQESSARENDFFNMLTHLVDGFKEVKLNARRNRELFAELVALANSVMDLKTRTGYVFADHFIFSQTTFYILLATIVFIMPEWFPASGSGRVMSVTAAILFVIGPLSTLIGTIPIFSTADVAVQNIAALEGALDRMQPEGKDSKEPEPVPASEFQNIVLSNLDFAYRDRDGNPTFEVGPLNLTIHRQEILFIVGGNGSGKSTLLKMITGLYYPEAGSVQVDGISVSDLGYERYRNLFSAIFSDYHLFDRVFGVEVSSSTVNSMLERMELAGKTRFENGRFVTQELSTGQRKRLALIISLLEDRPIYVFDEWAADQDPHFRQRFYQEILPDLKRKQKTVIAATHDERYFDIADRVLKMENGKFV
jgi:putative pyoverdin transport system ATP-binding/permease protein